MNFNSHADSVVGYATGLVNVATEGWRQGRAYERPTDDALLDALVTALGGGAVRGEEDALLALGMALRPVYEAVDGRDVDTAAAVVNELLRTYRPTPYLDHHDREPWHLHFHGEPADDPSGWGGGCAVALATVLGSEHASRLGVCSAERCDRVFVDVSRNGLRRFCSTACQNRVKAAAHRARQR